MPETLPPLSADWIGVTVSSGTLRIGDLMVACCAVLRSSEPHAHLADDLAAAYAAAVAAGDVEGEHLTLEDAICALETFAPAGSYFGTLEGDGACYGFWGACDASDECQCTDCTYFRCAY